MKIYFFLTLLALSSCTYRDMSLEHVEIGKKLIDSYLTGPTKDLFKVYHFIFEKAYSLNTEEGVRRYKIFKTNVQQIKEHNAKNLSWQMGVNQFTDLTDEEFVKLVGALPYSELTKNIRDNDDDDNIKPLPPQKSNIRGSNKFELFDELTKDMHRNLGAFDLFDELLDLHENGSKKFENNQVNNSTNITVLPEVDHRSFANSIKNQGGCGSCYAFATITAVETNYNIQYEKKFGQRANNVKLVTPVLAPQQIVDCVTWNGKKWGCQGGWMPLVMEQMATTGMGFYPQSLYPYRANNGNCTVPATEPVALLDKSIRGHVGCDKYRFTKPATRCTKESWHKLLSEGPLTVVYDTNFIKSYSKGILDVTGLKCASTTHAVTAVAWKHNIVNEVKKEYVVIQNSWGQWWGEKGFMNVYFNAENETCLLTSMGQRPVFDLNSIKK